MVAPLVGAWIETTAKANDLRAAGSHPSWVRGLKHHSSLRHSVLGSRTPRGCVD